MKNKNKILLILLIVIFLYISIVIYFAWKDGYYNIKPKIFIPCNSTISPINITLPKIWQILII